MESQFLSLGFWTYSDFRRKHLTLSYVVLKISDYEPVWSQEQQNNLRSANKCTDDKFIQRVVRNTRGAYITRKV
jgi:hypothetical protein